LGDRLRPCFKEVRELILRKCTPAKKNKYARFFEKQPFGELERFVTQKLLDVIKNVAKEELNSENWLHLVARLTGEAMNSCGLPSLSSWTRMSSTCHRKLYFLPGSTDWNPGMST